MDAIITAAGKNLRMITDFEKRNKKPIHKLKIRFHCIEYGCHEKTNSNNTLSLSNFFGSSAPIGLLRSL